MHRSGTRPAARNPAQGSVVFRSPLPSHPCELELAIRGERKAKRTSLRRVTRAPCVCCRCGVVWCGATVPLRSSLSLVCCCVVITMASSAYINQLLEAEKRAQEIVEQARKKKAARLKEAKNEADKELVAFREQQEKLFNEHKAQMGSNTGEQQLITETEKTIQSINETFKKNKEGVKKATKQSLEQEQGAKK
ncbi:unnamed protein product [Vitrella brassicaformis CCMP3155]|uniref:V-type proton ATPase subunit G n=1 Tax=Vitrella brassicaformis (strain CCMP3155) TaxID=1169540 RepID=A0A0G4EH04_VITBC|nr:unnamed protein product [Vitrella brassicaformis CCMP3155]|eukprot:CEL95749.1 unnamed protein product [Vitrella brassicaformis CCMP3155]